MFAAERWAVRFTPRPAVPAGDFGGTVTIATHTPCQDLAALLEEIRRGSTEAEVAFFRMYAGGIRYILKRHVGPQNLEQRLVQLRSMIVKCIIAGWSPEDGRLTPLIHAAMNLCGFAHTPVVEDSEVSSIEAIRRALRGLTAREREALTRYYLRREDADQVADSVGIPQEKLHDLIKELKLVIHPPVRMRAAAAN